MNEYEWQRSSYCGGGGNNCVEIAATDNGIALRESDRPTELLATSPKALDSLLLSLKEGPNGFQPV